MPTINTANLLRYLDEAAPLLMEASGNPGWTHTATRLGTFDGSPDHRAVEMRFTHEARTLVVAVSCQDGRVAVRAPEGEVHWFAGLAHPCNRIAALACLPDDEGKAALGALLRKMGGSDLRACAVERA